MFFNTIRHIGTVTSIEFVAGVAKENVNCEHKKASTLLMLRLILSGWPDSN